MLESFASSYSEEQLLAAVDFAIARVQSRIPCGSCTVLWDGAVRHGVHHEIDAGLFVGFYRQVTGARAYGYGFDDIDMDNWDSLGQRGQRDIRIARLMEFKEAIKAAYEGVKSCTEEEQR